MKTLKKNEIAKPLKKQTLHPLVNSIADSWSKISPFWPLKNLIAVNPISGFEDLPFDKALLQAQAYFQQKNFPEEMEEINRETIKWLQVFFDAGQSSIQMPFRELGFLKSVLKLLVFDEKLKIQTKDKNWLKSLPSKPLEIISECLNELRIPEENQTLFLTLMLTTLPGWAAHIQYRTNWSDSKEEKETSPVTQSGYLALRLVLTTLIWKDAKELLIWHQKGLSNAFLSSKYSNICSEEEKYQSHLITSLRQPSLASKPRSYAAQFVFCIDVRSEPFRRAIENQGLYETYSLAGFFGLPISVKNEVTKEQYASCPALIKPSYTISEQPTKKLHEVQSRYKKKQNWKQIHQSLKYTFGTPFSLAEATGLWSGLWMGAKSLFPSLSSRLIKKMRNKSDLQHSFTPHLDSIPINEQVSYAAGVLKLIGMTEHFAPVVIFCGHGSQTENNAFKTALDCGACSGRHGASNAKALAKLLNKSAIRNELKKHNIFIPNSTCFLGAQHNTTTDEVELFDQELTANQKKQLDPIKLDLAHAKIQNNIWRSDFPNSLSSKKQAVAQIEKKSVDWAQVRPEWGLARNASFIVGPRRLTDQINLDGRAFLHSYEWEKDSDSSLLTAIMTAPMVVAQWINSQYLFSTLDNVAFGSGSKVTKNITGKLGIMQGNASDLMHGLPLQSVYKSDVQPYHQPIRLTSVIYAPLCKVNAILKEQPILKKLLGNQWMYLICFDPENNQDYLLQKDLSWSALSTD